MDEEILEVVAEAVHETWMAGRMAEGWVYGEKRDDALKTHPCIVPYSELPEGEKVYDRATAQTVVAVLEKQGYAIIRR